MMDLHNYEWFESHWLGGAVNDVPAGATAIHPAMRSATWAISTWSSHATRLVRNYLPDGISGSSFNHQGASEVNWRTSLWGEENYRKLFGIKNRYDPSWRLNCWHCVGYQGEEYEYENG
jgi:FAD/FMN-containing dehydrogenase